MIKGMIKECNNTLQRVELLYKIIFYIDVKCDIYEKNNPINNKLPRYIRSLIKMANHYKVAYDYFLEELNFTPRHELRNVYTYRPSGPELLNLNLDELWYNIYTGFSFPKKYIDQLPEETLKNYQREVMEAMEHE